MHLRRVIGEVIEFDMAVIERLDEFPVAHAHRAAGETALVAVRWIVPKETGALRLRSTGEQRQKTNAVAGLS